MPNGISQAEVTSNSEKLTVIELCLTKGISQKKIPLNKFVKNSMAT